MKLELKTLHQYLAKQKVLFEAMETAAEAQKQMLRELKESYAHVRRIVVQSHL